MRKEWNSFKEGNWSKEINVRDFIQNNITSYHGDEKFLEGKTEKTGKVFAKLQVLQKQEIEKGVLDIDLENISGINNFEAGYIDKENEVIVGLQTDKPLKRMINPYGGIRMVSDSLANYGYEMNEDLNRIFTEYRKTHNQGVFHAYNNETLRARSAGLLTGLPDAYGRGRIIGDYRRIALYGIDYLLEEKKKDLDEPVDVMTEEVIRKREETSEQIVALDKIKAMAKKYGYDISTPAKDAKEAVQFIYFGYLAAVKESNGAAMSLGRTSSFIDIYIERDLKTNIITEIEAQEIIDQFIIKLRMVRHLRTPDYNELFAGDPAWVTEVIGGMSVKNTTLVTKTSFRFLHTLTNLSSAPEPNITVLWSNDLPEGFKKYCLKMSLKTSSIQYENDDIMRPLYDDDYSIACCISAMRTGKEMQLFGARCNLAKSLLFAINGGVDEISGKTIIDGVEKNTEEILSYDAVMDSFKIVMAKVAKLYVNTMNVIHYMHDKYAYEAGQMALHDSVVKRYMAFGVAGLSIIADSLSAIKYSQVKPIRENGIAVDFEIAGEYPQYGNDIDDVDNIGKEILEIFISELRKTPAYRNAKHTLSVLTITSNIVYGKKTGSTPDGRKIGEPFAPGANPLHGRDKNGALASLNSVSKLEYKDVCDDGISNTFTIVPNAIGKLERHQVENLVSILDGYFVQGGHHLNVNVLDREMLLDAVEHPDKYPSLTIRVSGYAVNFNRLTKEQQMDVINRSFHEKM